VTTSKSHGRRDEHGNGRKSRRMRRHHHSLDKSTRISNASSMLRINPSVYPIRIQRIRLEKHILQGEIRKIKQPNFNGE
jgi:hypothetical protein